MANGMTLDREGRLVVCEQGTRARRAAITRIDRATRQVSTVVDAYEGLPLNSPNDVVVARDGSIWFTDPSYGHLQGFRPEPVLGDRVYRHDPAAIAAAVVADGFDKPNGIALSPDERVLYVTDSGAATVIAPTTWLGGQRSRARAPFASTTLPDGIKVDGEGRVYVSAADGVQVFDPAGELVGEIPLPGAVNFCFGGPGRGVLFITTDDAVWAAVLTPSPPREPEPMDLIRTRRIIDDAGADAVMDAAESTALRDGHRVVIAVVDPAGELIALRRTPGAQVASSRVAVDKARTAAIFVRPSREMEEQVTGGRLGALALHGAACADRRDPAEGGRRGRRRDRHERRDARRGRGGLDRRRGCGLLRARAAGAHLRGRRARRRGHCGGGCAPRRRACGLRCRRRRRAHLPAPSGHCAGRERRGHDRQGAHRRDLPPAEQGLRGSGLRRAPLCAASRPRRAAAGRHADQLRRRGRRRDRRERRHRPPTRTRSSP